MTDWRIRRFPILASTNDLALEWMRAGLLRAGDVIVADEQTSGRGRPGRSWHSARGALLFSAVLPFRPQRVGWAALLAGLAVARAARELGVPAGVKWPNDVVVDGAKLAGILVETSVSDRVAVGVGLNVTNTLPDPAALGRRVTRLADHAPGTSCDEVLPLVLRHLGSAWELLESPAEELLAAWRELDSTLGRRVRWSAGERAGIAEGLAHDGALLLRLDSGELARAEVGEVSFLDEPAPSP